MHECVGLDLREGLTPQSLPSTLTLPLCLPASLGPAGQPGLVVQLDLLHLTHEVSEAQGLLLPSLRV